MGKGSEFERSICKQLSLWWTDGKRDDIFWRSSQSGGRATSRAKKGKKTAGQEGDICATHRSGDPLVRLFSIELKRGYNAVCPDTILSAGPTAAQQQFDKFLTQAMEASRRGGTYFWLLIHKIDKRSPMVYFPYRFFVYMNGEASLVGSFPLCSLHKVKLKSGVQVTFMGMTLDRFLKKYTKQDMKELYSRIK